MKTEPFLSSKSSQVVPTTPFNDLRHPVQPEAGAGDGIRKLIVDTGKFFENMLKVFANFTPTGIGDRNDYLFRLSLHANGNFRKT